MALATTCPQCQTSFKVVPDQLKLRRGLVRCGVCQHVFSGIDNLRYVNEPRSTPRPSAAPSNPDSPDLKTAFFLPETVIGEGRPDPRREGPGASPARPEPPPRREPTRLVGDEARDAHPPAHEAGPGHEADRGHEVDHGDEAGRDHDDAVGALARSAGSTRASPAEDRRHDVAIVADSDQPEDFVDSLSGAFAPVRQRAPTRVSQRRLAITVGALAVLLVLQLALGARDLLAARAPMIRPLLSTLGAPLGLQIELPRMPRKLTIESFELAGTGSAGVYRLNALLRNRASHPVQWPAIELTLTDAFGGVVASRVLLPDEYHDDASIADGFAGNSEKSVGLDIAIDEVVPSGYRAILFYP
ncbi:MAG: DUF3426 domain-containing protein [Burkholderiaceae bacterium]